MPTKDAGTLCVVLHLGGGPGIVQPAERRSATAKLHLRRSARAARSVQRTLVPSKRKPQQSTSKARTTCSADSCRRSTICGDTGAGERGGGEAGVVCGAGKYDGKRGVRVRGERSEPRPARAAWVREARRSSCAACASPGPSCFPCSRACLTPARRAARPWREPARVAVRARRSEGSAVSLMQRVSAGMGWCARERSGVLGALTGDAPEFRSYRIGRCRRRRSAAGWGCTWARARGARRHPRPPRLNESRARTIRGHGLSL